jgi:hypothetical protein
MRLVAVAQSSVSLGRRPFFTRKAQWMVNERFYEKVIKVKADVAALL